MDFLSNLLRGPLSKLDVINVLAGFLLGLLPILLPAAVRLIQYVRSSARTKYIGRFYLYHWSASQEVLRKKVFDFSLSVAGQVQVKGPRDPVTGLSYRGLLLKRDFGTVYVDIVSREDGGRLLVVLNNPIIPHFDVATGVFCSINLEGTPTAWRCVLSRIELPEKDILTYLGRRELLNAPRILALPAGN